MYGPFKFSENRRPISPFLWLCPLESNVELSKPFQIILPHFLNKDKAQINNIAFVKATHDDQFFQPTQTCYKFETHDSNAILTSSGDKNYGILETDHCCFYCLTAKNTAELLQHANYSLAQVNILSPPRTDMHFCALFLLPTCQRVSNCKHG